MKIDCVDAFKGEISKAVEQKIQVELRKWIGLCKVDWLQDFKFNFKSKYNLIWCINGFSYLEDSDAMKFL
jgi:hypothetical protein